MSDREKTPSGDLLYRYENAEKKEFKPAFGHIENIKAIDEHIQKYIGEIESVFHEVLSDIVHIDIHWVKPNRSFPFHTLVTSGMSDKPMTVPEGMEEYQYAEMCVLLPEDWKIEADNFEVIQKVFEDENNYWPIRWLKTIARFPHEHNTWVGYGHTIPNGEEAGPFAENTKMGCILLVPSISLPEDFFELKIDDRKTIKFYCLCPIYKEEMQLKINKGTDALLTKFEKFNVSDVLDVERPNTCRKKGFFR